MSVKPEHIATHTGIIQILGYQLLSFISLKVLNASSVSFWKEHKSLIP